MGKSEHLEIDSSASAMDMMAEIFGTGIEVVSASYTGAASASGVYSGGDSGAADLTPADTGVILSTGKAKDIVNETGDVNKSAGTTTVQKTAGDSDLSQIAGAKTYDAAILEATFVPDGSVLTIQVVFSSEEYLEYVGSGFNDAVGIFVNGQQAELTTGDGEITINNINETSNKNLYIDNAHKSDSYDTEMDGFTVSLTLKAPVKPGVENTIKIGIADAGDAKYDSNLLIAGSSAQTALVAGDDAISVHGTAPGRIDVLANDASSQSATLTITAINGVPVVAGDSVDLPSGETITLNADGSFSVKSDGDDDETVFSYTVADGAGNTDVAFVTVTTTPCFVAGTCLETAEGPKAVELVSIGDLVRTRDHGLQPVRWIGQASRPARGPHAPIRISRGLFGQHGQLLVSPQHRILFRTVRAELLFETDEVLVKAKDLVDGCSIERIESDQYVRYFHILFDRHEIVIANGLETESYQPGDHSLEAFDRETRAEILDLMAIRTGPFGPAARPTLQSYEARLLLA